MWIGAGVQVMPGVTIGSNVVIGGGSVVVKDIPSNVVAVGTPCRVVRPITDADSLKSWNRAPTNIRQKRTKLPKQKRLNKKM